MKEPDVKRMWEWEDDRRRQDVSGAFNGGFALGMFVTVALVVAAKSWGWL